MRSKRVESEVQRNISIIQDESKLSESFLSIYLCSKEDMESSVSSNFLNLLRHQINDAKMTELYDKNLGSIMIEKSHKVIARGQNLKSSVTDLPLEQLSVDQFEFQSQLSEEMYGRDQNFSCISNDDLQTMLNNFYSLLDQLTQIWDKITHKCSLQQTKIKTIPIKFNQKSSNSSPMKIITKTHSPTQNQTKSISKISKQVSNDLLSVLKQQNASFQSDKNQQKNNRLILNEQNNLKFPQALSPIRFHKNANVYSKKQYINDELTIKQMNNSSNHIIDGNNSIKQELRLKNHQRQNYQNFKISQHLENKSPKRQSKIFDQFETVHHSLSFIVTLVQKLMGS